MDSKQSDPKPEGVKEESPGKRGAKKDLVAELDLPSLLDGREEAARRHRAADRWLKCGQALHILVFGLAAWGVLQFTIRFGDPEDEPVLFIVGGVLCLVAFFPTVTVHWLQDKAHAASKHLKATEDKIAFCNVVLDKAKRIKVRKYAEAWVEKKELS
jgi:hypothetical protein